MAYPVLSMLAFLLVLFIPSPANCAVWEGEPGTAPPFITGGDARKTAKNKLAALERSGVEGLLKLAAHELRNAGLPREKISAVAWDAYARNAWYTAFLAESAAGELYGADSPPAMEASQLFEDASTYFRLTDEERERLRKNTAAVYAAAKAVLAAAAPRTMACTFPRPDFQETLVLRFEDGRELKLPMRGAESETVLAACPSGNKSCRVTVLEDGDGEILRVLSAAP